MGGHEDGDASSCRLVDQLPELTPGRRVDPTRRLVKEDDVRLMEDRDGESEFLFPSQGQGSYEVVLMRREAQLLQQQVRLTGYLVIAHAIDTSEETDVFLDGQVLIEREALTHIADMPLDLLMLRTDVKACHSTCTRSGLIKPCQHVHCRRFTCPVGTQEAEYLPTLHTERDIIDGMKGAESLH